MKIFSIQSKIILTIWGIVLGIVAQVSSMFISRQVSIWEISQCNCLVSDTTNIGWPFSFPSDAIFGDIAFWFGIFFWILVALIILSLIRYFKFRKGN